MERGLGLRRHKCPHSKQLTIRALGVEEEPGAPEGTQKEELLGCSVQNQSRIINQIKSLITNQIHAITESEIYFSHMEFSDVYRVNNIKAD